MLIVRSLPLRRSYIIVSSAPPSTRSAAPVVPDDCGDLRPVAPPGLGTFDGLKLDTLLPTRIVEPVGLSAMLGPRCRRHRAGAQGGYPNCRTQSIRALMYSASYDVFPPAASASE